MGGRVQETGAWEGTFRDSPRKCQESRAELPVLFLPGANCLISQRSAPNKPKVTSIFRGAGLACVSPEGQGRRGHQEASWKQCPEARQDGQGTRTPVDSARHITETPKLKTQWSPLSCRDPALLLLVTLVALRTDGTWWVTRPEMLCMTLCTLPVLPSMPENGYGRRPRPCKRGWIWVWLQRSWWREPV